MKEIIIELIKKQSKNKTTGKIMVEFPSPNTNKPLHLGHLRNMAIGESISRILELNQNRVIRLKRLKLHGIIKKATQSYKYYLTKMGKEVAITAMKLKEFVIIPALNY